MMSEKKEAMVRLLEWHAAYPPESAGVWHFLVGVKDGKFHTWDGMHSDPEDVAEALKLHNRISAIRADGVTWRMVTVQAVPDLDPPVNEEAIAVLNANLR